MYSSLRFRFTYLVRQVMDHEPWYKQCCFWLLLPCALVLGALVGLVQSVLDLLLGLAALAFYTLLSPFVEDRRLLGQELRHILTDLGVIKKS